MGIRFCQKLYLHLLSHHLLSFPSVGLFLFFWASLYSAFISEKSFYCDRKFLVNSLFWFFFSIRTLNFFHCFLDPIFLWEMSHYVVLHTWWVIFLLLLQDFVFLLSFWIFYYHGSRCESFCVYSTWWSLSFLDL